MPGCNLYTVSGGVLRGPSTFHVPTGTKFYRRPDVLHGRPVGVVLHYTACRASVRPIVDLARLIRRAGDRLDDGNGAISALQSRLENRTGSIPDAVSLTVQNAGRDRKASWCLCIGAERLDDGTVPVVQYSPSLSTCGTWHAGSPATWQMRRRYGGRTWKTSRGDVRWDGREYRWPRVDVGGGFVIGSPNAWTIGIEMMSLGRMPVHKRIGWPGVPVGLYGGVYYEQPSAVQLATLRNVLSALRAAYGPLPVWGHRDLTPWNRTDPWPPYPTDL